MISRLAFLCALPGLGFLRRFVPSSPPRTWVAFTRVMSLDEVWEIYEPAQPRPRVVIIDETETHPDVEAWFATLKPPRPRGR